MAPVDLLPEIQQTLQTHVNDIVRSGERLLDQVKTGEPGHDLERIVAAGRELRRVVDVVFGSVASAGDRWDVDSLGHLFRSPLTAVVGYCDLLAEGGSLPAHTADLEHIRLAGGSALVQVERLLDIARGEASQPQSIEPVEVHSGALGNEPARHRLLVVDDDPVSCDLLARWLGALGYTVLQAQDGAAGLVMAATCGVDLVLLDVRMIGMDGFEVCRRLRSGSATNLLPVVMLTAGDHQERARALECGADDLLPKPFERTEVLARIRSLLRIKANQDIIRLQASELAELNRTLEARVTHQVSEIERLGRLRRFLSPELAEIIVNAQDESLLATHRQEIAVVSCRMPGFAALAETSEPEIVMDVLREYHATLGAQVHQFDGTIGQLSGQEVVVIFNDPVPCTEPAAWALRMAVGARDALAGPITRWRARGLELGFGAGIDLGYATLGPIGFADRLDYAAIGNVTNIAVALGAAAAAGQILVTQRVRATVDSLIDCSPMGDLPLAGLRRPIAGFNIERLRGTPPEPRSPNSNSPLSVREREVLQLVATGKTNRDIAAELVLSERTVAHHLDNIFNKLGVSSRAAATAVALRSGWT